MPHPALSQQRQTITCVIADDHPVVTNAVRAVLVRHDIDITGSARDGFEALKEIESKRPTVALVDVRLPELDGIEVTRAVAARTAETAVILYTGHADRPFVTEALDAGARGFALKEAPLPDLVRAIEMVALGRLYIDPVLTSALVGDTGSEILTQREREILRLVAAGLTNAGIGQRLFISPETVRTHVSGAMAKLGVSTRTEAVATALRRCLIA